jgi:CheY-like chemotaxis protein
MGLALGANDYLVKPIRRDVLVTIVQRWVSPSATVLVIDDEQDARQVIRDMLAGTHYQVIEASDGRAGLEVLQTQPVDLVLLDLMMPELDGFAVLEHIRGDQRTREVPVIVVTANDLTDEEQQWLMERSLYCVQKGQLEITRLILIIEQLLHQAQ